jgi:hypothetical protein
LGPCTSQNASGSFGANFSARSGGAHSAKGGSGTWMDVRVFEVSGSLISGGDGR